MKLLSLFALACAVFAQPALQPSPNCCDPALPTCMAIYTRCVQNAGSTGGTPSSGVCAALLCPSPYPVRMSPSVPPSSKPSVSTTPSVRMSASLSAAPSSKPSGSSTPTARMSISPPPARPSVTSAPTPQMSVSPPPAASITPASTPSSTLASTLTATPASTRTLASTPASTPATTPTPTRRPDTGVGNVSGISGGGSSNNPPNPTPTVSAGEVVAGVIGAFGILAVVSLAYAYYIRGSPRFRPTSPKLRNSPISESNAVYTRNVMHKINI